MAAGTFTLYTANKADLAINDLLGFDLKIALVDSTYIPDMTGSGDSVWADVSGSEIAGGFGYTTGGATLASVTKEAIIGGFRLSSQNVSWVATGGSIPAWRYAVMYVAGTLWGKTNPLIGMFLGDDTPADIPEQGADSTLTLVCPADGWFDVT